MIQKHQIRLFLFGALLATCGAVFTSTATAQVSGTVINMSLWENDETVVPPQWHIAPDEGAVSNAHGRIIIALIDLADPEDPQIVTKQNLVPQGSTNAPASLPIAIAGTDGDYLLGSGALAPGKYRLIAWIDGNENGRWDEGEPNGTEDITLSGTGFGSSPSGNNTVRIKDDIDIDSMEDWWEVHWFGDMSQSGNMDYDNDGLTNAEEYDLIYTSGIYVEPNNWDTDDDGMDDAWETFYGLNPTSPLPNSNANDARYGDPDTDGVINYDEYTGPDGIGWRADSDDDNIAEFTTSKDAMSPILADSDMDGVDDGNEFLGDLTHPVHSMSSTNFYPRSLELSVNAGSGVTLTDPAGSLYAFRSGGGTVEFWIRPGTDGNGIIYGFTAVPAGVPNFRISLEDYRPKMEILSGANVVATVGGANANGAVGAVQELEPDVWTHVACVIAPNNNSLNIYIDGILLIAQETFIKPDFTLGSPVICQDFTDGYIDELRVWNYPRASADVEYWSKRFYPAPGYAQQWASRASGSLAQIYKYSNPHPLLGYFRFDDGGSLVENFAFINHGLYPNATSYHLPPIATASVTTDQAVSMVGSDDADGDGLPEWWVELHNLEKYPEYYTSAYGPITVPCPAYPDKVSGFKYFRSFVGYGSIGTQKAWQEDGGTVYHDPKTRPDFYCGDRSTFTRYVYLFAQPVECPLEIFTPGMLSTTIHVNGIKVTTVGDEENGMQSYDIAQYMQVGRNMIHVECESTLEEKLSVSDYDISDFQAYNSGLNEFPIGCDDKPYKFKVAIGKFDAKLKCNGISEIVRGDEGRADPRSVWHCQVWSSFYETVSDVPAPDQEWRAVPENTDYGLPLNAERDNNPLDPDAADDNLDAIYEYICGTNPRDRDSNNNGVGDGNEDFDADGLVNREEQRFGSDPWLADSDDDGVIDGADVGSNGHPAQSLSPQNNLGIHFGGTQADFLDFPKEQRFALNKWTGEVWIKPDSDEADGGIILQRSVASNAVNYEVGLNAANIPYVRYVSIGGTEVRADAAAAVVADGTTWTHIAASYYDRDLTLYINGTNVASTTGASFPAIYAGGPIVQNIGRGFKGCIDELRLWNDDRTSTEIINNRDEVLTGLESDLVAYYRFDDNTSYTNLPPVVGTSANNGIDGSNATVAWTWGQVEDNVLKYSSDWQYQWSHAASFNGNVKFTTDHIITGPPRLQVFIQTDDAINAGALWSHNGGAAWNDSGYLETRLSSGDYSLIFKEIDGWITPSATNVTLIRGESTIVTSRYTQTANITVIIDNNSDIKNHATWSIDGGITRHGTGTKIGGLQPGLDYNIIFSDISSDVPGWDRPTTIQGIVLLEGEDRTETASYTQIRGSLQINFTPDDAPAAGRWRVSGNTNWFGSGEIVTNLSYGAHDVEYNNVQWWQAPDDEIISIEDSTLVSESRNWTKLPEPSAITTIINPPEVVAAGAVWQMNGATYSGGESVIVEAGNHAVSFNDINGWMTPLDIIASASDTSTTITGTYYRVDIIGGDGNGDLDSPRGVAATLSHIYIADSDNHRIQIYDVVAKVWKTLGRYGSGLGQLNRPFGITIDDNGNLWIADTGNHRIQRYTVSSGAWASFGSHGTGIGQFNAPYDLDIDSGGNLYVADYHNSRIQKRTPAGAWSVIVTSGTESARVRHPSGITVDDSNNIYVSDYDPAGVGQAGRIQKFNSTGAFLSELGGELDGAGGLNQNMGLSVAANMQLFAANTFDNEVLTLNSNGVWSSVIDAGVLSMPRDVEVDSLGNIIIADSENNRVVILPATEINGIELDVDSDNDGFDNRSEIIAGTDLNDNLSFPENSDATRAPNGAASPLAISELDYDGDGKSDLTTFGINGGAGLWYIRLSDSGKRLSGLRFGNALSTPIRGDFNGDGKSDLAVFQPNGTWYISYNLGRSTAAYTFGDANSIPVPGDYDGDGTTDLGVYQKQAGAGYPAGQWYAYSLTKGFISSATWGNAAFLPAPADYDGDQITDVAVFNPDTGQWYVRYSSYTGRTLYRSAFNWGNADSLFIAADKDGSLSQDFVVYDTAPTHASSHNWYVSRSSNAGIPYQSTRFGNNRSTPVAGDYDGDTIDDYTVFNDGQWYIWKSSQGSIWIPTSGSSWARPIPQFNR